MEENDKDIIIILPPPIPKPNFDADNIKMLYPSDIDNIKSPREYGQSLKRNGNKKRRR